MVDRRTFLLATGLAGAAAVTGGAASAAGTGSVAAAHDAGLGRFDQPQQGFAPATTVLRRGTARALGLDTATVDAALARIAADAHPASGMALFPGAVTLLAHHGMVFADAATGWSLRYSDGSGTELPPAKRIPMRTDTIFDMASLSKLFTSLVALHLLETRQLDLDTPVAHYLPGYAANGKATVTPRMLLTHTAGLPPDPTPSLWQGYPDIPSRRQAILNSPLESTPGTTYDYSDLSMLSMQLLIEKVTRSTLDREVRARVTAPLGMRDTCYNPSPALRHRIAPTEFQVGPGTTNRGLVWGQVHDENAWAMGGVAGHAGVFSTAGDLAIVAQAILNGGVYRGRRILSPASTELIFTNFNARFPDDAHGLGFELDQMFYMGGLSSLQTAGHTGFTGTTVVIDRLSRTTAILLTNRVHPNRSTNITPERERLATTVARAMRVAPVAGNDYWCSHIGNASTATLTSKPFETGLRAASLNFSAFVDTEATDTVTVEYSTDGGATWTPREVHAYGPGAPPDPAPYLSGHSHRQWWSVRADFPETETSPTFQVRWRYTTDKLYTGRGVCLDGINMITGRMTLFDAEKDPSVLIGDGWQRETK